MKILVNEFCGMAFPLQLSRELARRGHEIHHVFFADNTSTPKGDTEHSHSTANLTVKGLRIKQKFSKHSLLTRRQADIAYGHAVAAEACAFRPDIILSADMPLDGQRILQRQARKLDAKFVFWVQDVYSEAVRFVLNGRSRILSRMAGAYYRRLERVLLLRSDAVVCICNEFADLLAGWGVPQSHVTVIENWSPLDEVVPTPKLNPWSTANGVDTRFCFMYSGTLGLKHRPELLLALAEWLQGRPDATLVVIAAGAGADWLKKNSAHVSPGALRLLPFQPYEQLSQVLGSADVLISLLNSDAGAFAVPSKTLSYLCAARPLIVAAPPANRAAQLVQLSSAGLVISPDDPAQFISAAERLLDDAALRSTCAANARAYAEANFAIGAIADRFCSTFDQMS